MSPRSPFATRLLLSLVAVCALPVSGLLAIAPATDDSAAQNVVPAGQNVDPSKIPDDAPLLLNNDEIDSSYVGDSNFRQKRFDGAGAGRNINYGGIDEVQNAVEIDRHIHLFNRIYMKLGVKYERFDFNGTTAPIPSTLQSLHGIIGLEYVIKGEPALSLYVNPGVFLSHFSHVNFASVDAPVDLVSGVPVPFFHNVYGIVGLHISALAHYPVYPILGVAWIINDRLSLQAFPPEPRLVYKVTDYLDVFAGAELLGEAYKTSYRNGLRPQEARLNGAVVDYSEDRVGAGLTYNINKAVNIDFGGGCSLERDFNYYRPDAPKQFITHPAPYAKLEFSATF